MRRGRPAGWREKVRYATTEAAVLKTNTPRGLPRAAVTCSAANFSAGVRPACRGLGPGIHASPCGRASPACASASPRGAPRGCHTRPQTDSLGYTGPARTAIARRRTHAVANAKRSLEKRVAPRGISVTNTGLSKGRTRKKLTVQTRASAAIAPAVTVPGARCRAAKVLGHEQRLGEPERRHEETRLPHHRAVFRDSDVENRPGAEEPHRPDQPHIMEVLHHSFARRSLSALVTTDTELIAIAAAAKMGESSRPNTG